MTRVSGALIAGLALVTGAGIAGAAKAQNALYYYDDGSATITYRTAPARVYYYSAPVMVAPAPRVYYYSAPATTTYYYGPSTQDDYSASSSVYVSTPAPYYYAPPGLSIITPLGVYAPFYGGYASYGVDTNAGRSGYRLGY